MQFRHILSTQQVAGTESNRAEAAKQVPTKCANRGRYLIRPPDHNFERALKHELKGISGFSSQTKNSLASASACDADCDHALLRVCRSGPKCVDSLRSGCLPLSNEFTHSLGRASTIMLSRKGVVPCLHFRPLSSQSGTMTFCQWGWSTKPRRYAFPGLLGKQRLVIEAQVVVGDAAVRIGSRGSAGYVVHRAQCKRHKATGLQCGPKVSSIQLYLPRAAVASVNGGGDA